MFISNAFANKKVSNRIREKFMFDGSNWDRKSQGVRYELLNQHLIFKACKIMSKMKLKLKNNNIIIYNMHAVDLVMGLKKFTLI